MPMIICANYEKIQSITDVIEQTQEEQNFGHICWRSWPNNREDRGQGQKLLHAKCSFILMIICATYEENSSRTAYFMEQTLQNVQYFSSLYCQVMAKWRYGSRSKVITHDTPSYDSDNLYQIWNDSVQIRLNISRSNITGCWTQYKRQKAKTLFRIWTHKRHPIPHKRLPITRPHGRAMGSLLWDLWKRATARYREIWSYLMKLGLWSRRARSNLRPYDGMGSCSKRICSYLQGQGQSQGDVQGQNLMIFFLCKHI